MTAFTYHLTISCIIAIILHSQLIVNSSFDIFSSHNKAAFFILHFLLRLNKHFTSELLP